MAQATTNVIGELLEQLGERAAEAALRDLCIGAHWTCVTLTVGDQVRGGLASTLAGGDHHHGGGPPVRDAGHLLDRDVSALASLARSDRLLEAGVGLATINALLDVDEEAVLNVNAVEVIAEQGAGRNIAVIGHFPFVPRLRKVAGTLWVLELNPRGGDLPADRAPEILPQADVVALTGTSLLNGTFDALMANCRPDAFVVMLGATTPLSPLLFDAGVDAVAGSRVVEPEVVMRAVSQGATFRQIPGKRLLTMFDDPSVTSELSPDE
jgi:hypothetical protein